MTDLVYVYAILPRAVSTPLTGIESRAIRWVVANELAAAVSDVPEDQFDEEPLNANVRDMGWLGPRAVAHQEINARLHEAADAIVPLAFGTVFRNDDRVLQMLTQQAGALTTRLEKVQGAAEWVVALHVLREPDPSEVAAASSAVQALRAQVEASSPGRAHLLRRQLAELERVEARRLQAETATAVLERLKSVATDTYQESLPADAAERPLLRASVLVPRADESRFLDTVHDLRVRWPEPTFRVLVTGPWPPYRFAGLDRGHA